MSLGQGDIVGVEDDVVVVVGVVVVMLVGVVVSQYSSSPSPQSVTPSQI
jgi:hypothetical protein